MPPAESGIRFDWIFVREIELRDTLENFEAPGPGVGQPVDMEIQSYLSDDGRACRVAVTMSYSAPPTFTCRIRTEAQFSAVGDLSVDIQTFAERQGPVLMIPFVREHLANITGRTRLGQVLLNPLNMQHQLTGEHRTPPARD